MDAQGSISIIYSVLPKYIKSQNDAIIDSLPKLSNKVCYKFFKADNPINTIHTIMADLVTEFGYEQTKAIISNLHKLNENADTKDQFKLISR